MEFLIGVVVGFVLGYGVRSLMSRYRRARTRLNRGYPDVYGATVGTGPPDKRRQLEARGILLQKSNHPQP
jgi:hypothetical protein